MKRKRRPCPGPEYCAEGVCEPSLEELAERLAERSGREVEMIFSERGAERIVLCNPADGNDYVYEVEVSPRCWARTHHALPGDRGRAAKHTNWDLDDPNAMTFAGIVEDLEAHLRNRGAVKIERGNKDGTIIAQFSEDQYLPHSEIWSPK